MPADSETAVVALANVSGQRRQRHERATKNDA
jgi:hypothetical protein